MRIYLHHKTSKDMYNANIVGKMQTKKFTTEELEMVRVTAIGHKYGCSREYVRKILKGDSPRNTIVAQKILQDAVDMLGILERETKVTV